MTTTQNDKTDVRSVNPPSLFNIQYPNSRTGMFSLRAPFKNLHIEQSEEPLPTRNANPTAVQPKYLHMDRDPPPPPQRSYDQEILRRDAQVQCSLILPDNRERIVARRQPTFMTEPSNYGYLSPRYRVQLKLQPAQPNIYEVWNVGTPPRSLPPNEPIRRQERSIRPRSPRLVSIKSPSDDESDYTDDDDDAYLLYTHYPPAPVRMVHLRQDASTICY